MFWDSHTSGVDAIAQADWQEKNNYVNAPFALCPLIFDLIQEQKADATIIAPHCPGQTWFQGLQRMNIDEPIPLPISNRTILAIGPKAEPLKNRLWIVFAWRVPGTFG